MSGSEGRKERGRSSSPYGVVTAAHYESGPPATKMKFSEDDGEVMEVVKEEEWEERRKKTTTKTRNVERVVQREVILEDGVIVGDTGPVVSEDAVEDVVVKEEVSNENAKPEGQLSVEPPPMEGWVAAPGAVVISEKSTKTTKSHDEVQDEFETEEVQHCGDITNEEAEDHLKGGADLKELISYRQSHGLAVAKPRKRVVHESTKKKGNVDTTEVKESSKIKDGHVLTETERTVRQEQYENESLPDSGSSLSDGSVHEATKESSHNIVHTKDEDLLEYYAVPKGGTLADGVKIGEGMHVVSEDVHEDKQGNDKEGEVELLRKTRKPSRRDALTKRLLNYDQEEHTRKQETDKWLESHFGSESGRSEDSIQDSEERRSTRHSSGGNKITITMSPYPASHNDDLKSPTSPNRRWTEMSSTSVPKAPPPPPPKPERYWNSGDTYKSPRSPVSPTFSAQTPDIQDSDITRARSRLRYTGLKLTDENKENDEPDYSMRSDVYSPSSENPKVQHTPFLKTYTPKDEIIYGSRFREGKKPSFNEKYVTRVDMTPHSLSNVGRSQSFHVQTLPYESKKSSTKTWLKSSKDYRSEERLDDFNSKRDPGHLSPYLANFDERGSANRHDTSYKNSERYMKSRSHRSPPREQTPPPPLKSKRNILIKNYSSSSGSGREAGTQTGPSPVPPPRMKRRKRPKSSYFFGQENGQVSNDSLYGTNPRSPNRYSLHETSYSDNNYRNDIRNGFSSEYDSLPLRQSHKSDRHPTKTSTTPTRGSHTDRHSYSHYSSNKSSWTNTVDPRRRPRNGTEEGRSVTLPRKTSENRSPKKTYVFGEGDPPQHRSHTNDLSYNERNKMHHVPISRSESTNHHRYSSYSNGDYKSNKHVGRSQSFNVQPGMRHSMSNGLGRPLSELSGHKSSTVYGSTPYVNNLRSPNLIATIARGSSTRINDIGQTNEHETSLNSKKEEKRDRFMQGLLNNAPELYHFMHGNENDTTDGLQRNERESSPKNNHKESSRYSPKPVSSPSYKARVFTFGKNDNNSLNRSGQLTEEEMKNLYNSNHSTPDKYYHQDIKSYPDGNNRRSTFNLKTSGSSLLYSPSFREQRDGTLERRPKKKEYKGERISGDFSRTNLSSGIHREVPVHVEIRDWNTR